MSEVSFAISLDDEHRVNSIVRRFCRIVISHGDKPLNLAAQKSLRMDLTAVHANGCPMDFERLLAASDVDLLHDVVGIERHIDRTTGKIKNHFDPRCSQPDEDWT